MQDARKELKQAVRDQITALARLNKAANECTKFRTDGRTRQIGCLEADYRAALDNCREADALVAFWRAVCRGKVSLG